MNFKEAKLSHQVTKLVSEVSSSACQHPKHMFLNTPRIGISALEKKYHRFGEGGGERDLNFHHSFIITCCVALDKSPNLSRPEVLQ